MLGDLDAGETPTEFLAFRQRHPRGDAQMRAQIARHFSLPGLPGFPEGSAAARGDDEDNDDDEAAAAFDRQGPGGSQSDWATSPVK